MEFAPVTPLVQNAGDAAADLLRLAILEGRLKPGERLKESALAESLGISRTPVRDALRTLQREGLVVALPNRGSVVREYTLDELHEIYDLRSVLEGHAARRAAESITPELLDELRASCRRADQLRCQPDAPILDLVHENERFHETVLKAAGSAKLASLARGLTEMPLIYRTYSLYSPEQRKQAEAQHEELVEALAAHDRARAARVMNKHILTGWNVLVERFDQLEGAK